jgi:hypothetical protein
MKAISPLGNEVTERFHAAMGWKAQLVEDYAGPGRHRMIFTKDL